MADLLIRNIRPRLKQQLEVRARKSRRSLSAEAEAQIERGLATSRVEQSLGSRLFTMIPRKYRGDDLVFEVHDFPKPPKLR
jgi:plasmid stability protein